MILIRNELTGKTRLAPFTFKPGEWIYLEDGESVQLLGVLSNIDKYAELELTTA